MSKNTAADTDKKLAKAFPKDVTPPQLMNDFAAWYRSRPTGCLGGVELFARKMGDFLPPEANIDQDFALFFNMGDGGAAGLWLKDDRDPDRAPFVLKDSEAGFFTLAPNFACFLDRLTKQQFSNDLPEIDFVYDPEFDNTPYLLDELAAWLSVHPVAAPVLAQTGLEDYLGFDDGSAQAWLEGYRADLEGAAMADPDKRAISEILTANGYLPKADEFGFGETAFRVFAAGETMVIKQGKAIVMGKDNALKPVKEIVQAALRPHLFAIREAHARGKKNEGLWPAAGFSIFQNGKVEMYADYHFEFAIGYDGFAPADFASDQERYPRKSGDLADWHRALIEDG